MVELKNCPFLIQGNWCNDIYGPCAAAKGNRCEVHQQLAKRDARIAELEAECVRLRKALKEVLNCEVVTDTGDYSKGGTGFDCNEVKEIIRGALAE